MGEHHRQVSDPLFVVTTDFRTMRMTYIRVVRIENFRGIKTFEWTPREGINCLVGPGISASRPLWTRLIFASARDALSSSPTPTY
jgi:hypothetical protein